MYIISCNPSRILAPKGRFFFFLCIVSPPSNRVSVTEQVFNKCHWMNKQPFEVVSVITFILQMRKLRLRNVKQFSRDHTDGQWWSLNQNLGSLLQSILSCLLSHSIQNTTFTSSFHILQGGQVVLSNKEKAVIHFSSRKYLLMAICVPRHLLGVMLRTGN